MSYRGKNLVGTLFGGYPNRRNENLGSEKEQAKNKNKANAFQVGRMEDVILILLFMQT